MDVLTMIAAGAALSFAALFSIEGNRRREAEARSRALSRLTKSTARLNHTHREALIEERRRLAEIEEQRVEEEQAIGQLRERILAATTLDDLADLWNDDE